MHSCLIVDLPCREPCFQVLFPNLIETQYTYSTCKFVILRTVAAMSFYITLESNMDV